MTCMVRTRLAILSCLLLAAALPAAAARRIDDTWLSEALLAELKATGSPEAARLGAQRYGQLSEHILDVLLDRVALGPIDDLGAVNDAVYVLSACRYLPLVEKLDGGAALADWLVARPAVARVLFRALPAGDEAAGKSLATFKELLDAEPEAVEAYANLAAAFATAQPHGRHGKPPRPCSLLDAFRYYTRSGVSFRYDLKTMPFELSRYLADSRLSLAERKWAVDQYAKHPNPARAYFDLRYDIDHLRKGSPKRISALEYTLPNLRKVGGVCIDQAYYAEQVCKSLGIPATIVVGRGRGGVGHAWFACLRVTHAGRLAEWDCRTGRYDAHKYYTGQVVNPATGETLLDSELMLTGKSTFLPLEKREGATSAVLLARLVDQAAKDAADRDLTALRALSKDHPPKEEREAAARGLGTEPPPRTRKLDAAVVRELIELSLRSNLVYRPAWETIIELRQAGRLPAADLDHFFGVLIEQTGRDFPEYSCDMVLRVIPTLENPKHRVRMFTSAAGSYGRRPDLRGRVLTALGDEFVGLGNHVAAVQAYQQAAEAAIQVPQVVTAATSKAEDLLVQNGRLDMAIGMYQRLFQRAPRTGRLSEAFTAQTTRQVLGLRLAALLRQAGKENDARRIEAMLGQRPAR
jgi:hypothetical protein